MEDLGGIKTKTFEIFTITKVWCHLYWQ